MWPKWSSNRYNATTQLIWSPPTFLFFLLCYDNLRRLVLEPVQKYYYHRGVRNLAIFHIVVNVKLSICSLM